MNSPSPRITQLYFYPVKSCAGTPLSVAHIGPRGIAHDREFMVVDSAGEFRTQRELPRLALVRPVLDEASLQLSAPDVPSLTLPLPSDHERGPVRIFRDEVTAADQGRAAAEWLSTYLESPCRLVRLPPDVVRPVDRQFARTPTDQVGFADGYPVLMISEESLSDLNTRLAAPLPMNRFRPNVVVRGWGEPYGEDRWATVRIGDVVFSLVKACARCAITTTNQATAERGLEPLLTLATYRRVARGVLFGQNLTPHSSGTISLGNELVIEQWRAMCEGRVGPVLGDGGLKLPPHNEESL